MALFLVQLFQSESFQGKKNTKEKKNDDQSYKKPTLTQLSRFIRKSNAFTRT